MLSKLKTVTVYTDNMRLLNDHKNTKRNESTQTEQIVKFFTTAHYK